MKQDKKKVSKFLSLVLRHKPEEIGLTLDAQGWARVEELIKKAKAYGYTFDRDFLNEVVADNDKQRFAFSEDGKRIRANQGHSIDVDLKLEVAVPPPSLFHGTATRFLDDIMKDGLKAMDRHDVHLSEQFATAVAVGSRHGKPVVLEVDAERMHQDGIEFRKSANGVWLVPAVDPKYLTFAGHVA